MKKLIALLKRSGVEHITGNYKTNFGFEIIKDSVNNKIHISLSADNKLIGNYLIFIQQVVENERRVIGKICDKKGQSIFLIKNQNHNIVITLNPFEDSALSDIGNFIAVYRYYVKK